MNLLIASNNKHKIEEICSVLAGKFDKIFSLRQMGIDCDPDENGSTFSENAAINAHAALCALKNLFVNDTAPRDDSETSQNINDFAVLADDTGLCVDALNGAPGIYSARYAAVDGNQMGAADHDDKKNREKLLCELRKAVANKSEVVKEKARAAHFECAVVLLFANGKTLDACGRVDGYITEKEYGQNGFGYDSLFFCNELGKTFAEATSEEKNSISHRGRALQNLLKIM